MKVVRERLMCTDSEGRVLLFFTVHSNIANHHSGIHPLLDLEHADVQTRWKPVCLRSWTSLVLRCCLLDLEDADVPLMKTSLLTILNKLSLKMLMQTSASWRCWCSFDEASLLTILNKLSLRRICWWSLLDLEVLMFTRWKPVCLQSWTRSVLRCSLPDLEDIDVQTWWKPVCLQSWTSLVLRCSHPDLEAWCWSSDSRWHSVYW